MHRVANVPIEKTMKCLLELKNEDKIKYARWSENTPEGIERAQKVMSITAFQIEWSLQNREIKRLLCL